MSDEKLKDQVTKKAEELSETELKGQIETEENIIGFLSRVERLAAFDIRDHELRRIIPARIEELKKDWEVYQESHSNSVVKVAIGKKLATADRFQYEYDYDASLFSTCIYKNAILRGGTIQRLTGTEEIYKYDHMYKIIYYHKNNKIEYRGDVMNSWHTTLKKFVTSSFGKEYIENWTGIYIPDSYHYNEWYQYLSEPKNYTKNPLPTYITDFMEVVYTIGNFIPVPLGFNERRRDLSEDYWDLTLLAMYRHYMEEDESNSTAWKDLFEQSGVKDWLVQYGTGQEGWNNFVDKNSMQPFVRVLKVDFNGRPFDYGHPLELWKDHFTGSVKPESKPQFKEFFTNATARILARGKLIADAYKKQLKESAQS